MALCLVLLVAILAPSCLGSDALVGGIQERKTDDPEELDFLVFSDKDEKPEVRSHNPCS